MEQPMGQDRVITPWSAGPTVAASDASDILLDPTLGEASSIPPVQADAVPGRPDTVTNRVSVLGKRQRGAIFAKHEIVHGEPECRELSELALAGHNVGAVAPLQRVSAHSQHVVVGDYLWTDIDIVAGRGGVGVAPQQGRKRTRRSSSI